MIRAPVYVNEVPSGPIRLDFPTNLGLFVKIPPTNTLNPITRGRGRDVQSLSNSSNPNLVSSLSFF